MQGAISLWQKLDMRRKAMIAGATAAMFAAILILARMGGSPQMALLYAGLDPAASGEVVAALDRQAISYRVEGDRIEVPADLRDGLRMTLAAEGLPANSGAGYELLDGLSGFGTTSQMFDAAYWRAREGELARTILANPAIRSARVHIARASDQPFARDQHPTASVTVRANGGLTKVQAKALRHLVAASVPGLRPGDVAVIDTETGLVGDAEGAEEPGSDVRAAEIRGNVERLLAAHLGPGKAAVEVAVDLVTEREAITERRFDPQGRVAVQQETEQKSGSNMQGQQAVGVASNLPDGDAAKGGEDSSKSSESREKVNYQVSETQRELVRAPGAIRRLSIAVLVDGRTVPAADGSTSVQPRGDDELAVLRDLIASAVGFDAARGDSLVVKSLVFEPAAAQGELAEAAGFSPLAHLDVMTLIQIGVLAVVALILGLFVLRPALTGARQPAGLPPPAPLALAGAGDPRVLTGEIDDTGAVTTMQVIAPAGGDLPADPVARLRRLIEERQTESAEILRGWMEREEERG